ncbi:MAG: 4-hydroxybenzoyl-CoA reductase subunit alpha [Kiritimatiellia bacterium]|jgi:4-hydroxybenzoyl-CoA reductase subunit alpha
MKSELHLQINGEPHDVYVDSSRTLLEVLRYDLGLTGSKQGCDKGDCGACTVLVDGDAVLSCCTLACLVQGGAIETIEGLANEHGPSRLQRSFDQAGAMQCGFCQPGMMMSAEALLRKKPCPSRTEIKQALSGNLCRCTGYTKILDAVQLAASDVPLCRSVIMSHPKDERLVIGSKGRKPDALDKTTGVTQYVDDITLPRMVLGKILRSPHAHARILAIRTDAAEAMPGVYAVMTGADLPTPYGVIPWTPDEHALALHKVRHVGDGVAAVAARDEQTALAALAAIEVDYEVLPAVLDPRAAMADGAQLVHEKDWKGRDRRSNSCKKVALSFGDVDAAFASAAAIVDDEWHFGGSTHAAIEPHCALARWSGDRLTLWSATQVSHYLHREIAKVLDIPQSKVRVIQPAVGGGFGGKSEPFDLEFCAAILARKAGRPVKILYTREEVFHAHRGRHPMDFHFKIACDAQGRITGVDNDILIDGGAFHSFGLVTTYYAGQLLAGPLRFGSYRYTSERVYTNKPACGPKRGHGSVQPRFPLETALDELAEKIGMDPIELRRVNAMESGETTINGMQMGSCAILECLEIVERESGWKERYGAMPTNRGLGVATSMYISGTAYPIYPNDMPQSGVQLRADRSGMITVFSGTNDIGQGSQAMLAYVVAEETGVPVDQIAVLSGDTDLTPVDLGAYSSRITLMAGTAAMHAARALATTMRKAVAAHWQVEPSQVRIELGRYVNVDDPEQWVDTTKAIQLAEAKFGTLGSTGGFVTLDVGDKSYRGGTIGASPAYSTTAHVVEVEVDPDTGKVTVLNVWAAHDCGKAINPVAVEGQIEGSVYMGLSESLWEGMNYTDTGLHRGPNLLDYRMATTVDTPEIHAFIVEQPDPNGPYGAKEAGEGPLHPVLPAIANAIRHATGGASVRSLPFTPERVLAAIEALQEPSC